jgi:hypothetical protein
MNHTHRLCALAAPESIEDSTGPDIPVEVSGIEWASLDAVLEALLSGRLNIRMPLEMFDPSTHERSVLKRMPETGFVYREYQ